MPIYEYSCDKCKKTIEVIQKMSDRSLRTHAGCGGKLTKLISRSAFQLKGTGWYVTDYGTRSKGEGSESAKSESSESTASTESKDAAKASETAGAKKDDAKSAPSTGDATPAAAPKQAKTTKKKS